MLQGILLVILVLVSIALIGVILLQRSEGGALGAGGGPSGFLTTRGAGDLLTRTTAILASIFFALCIVLTVVNGRMHHGESVVDRLKIDPLSPEALAQKPPLAPANPQTAPAPGATFTAPAPEVHTAPALSAPGTPSALAMPQPVAKAPPPIRRAPAAAPKSEATKPAPTSSTPAPTTPAPAPPAPASTPTNTAAPGAA